ncbi:hypothetical protein DXG01_003483 [Tephrocybe rancida]|nr:hypothetical protein DXG01_003483 [Tephrocybe rancida]
MKALELKAYRGRRLDEAMITMSPQLRLAYFQLPLTTTMLLYEAFSIAVSLPGYQRITYNRNLLDHLALSINIWQIISGFNKVAWDGVPVEWTAPRIPKARFKTIADGFLGMKGPLAASKLLASYQAKHFSVIGIWEFKSLLAGDERAFEAFHGLANSSKFRWTGCEHGGLCGLECPNKSDMDMLLIERVKMGYDAVDPICPSF